MQDYPTQFHELKITPEFFEAILNDGKRFEVRREDDKYFREGDKVNLKEWRPDEFSNIGIYTGREIDVLITYVLRRFPPALAAGWTVWGFEILGETR